MDCGICTSKTILLFLSLVFWGAGAALAYVGAYIIMSFRNLDSFIQDKQTMIPANIIIGTSVLMIIFGLVGCCATLRESKCGLGCFFMIIMIIFVAEVTALVFIFIYQGKSGQMNQDLERSMTEVFAKYDGHSPEVVDTLQTQGCEQKLEKFLQDVLTYAMLVILGFAIIKFFGMLSVCVITCKSGSRRSGYEPLYA